MFVITKTSNRNEGLRNQKDVSTNISTLNEKRNQHTYKKGESRHLKRKKEKREIEK